MKKLAKELLKNAVATENGFSVNGIEFFIDESKEVNKGTSNRGLWSDFRSIDGGYFIRLHKKDLLDIGKKELAAHLFNRG